MLLLSLLITGGNFENGTLCPRDTICATNTTAIVLLSFSRLRAYAMYPSMVSKPCLQVSVAAISAFVIVIVAAVVSDREVTFLPALLDVYFVECNNVCVLASC